MARLPSSPKANTSTASKRARKAITDLTPSGGVVGVLGDISRRIHRLLPRRSRDRALARRDEHPGGGRSEAALESDYEPPTTGTSRVSPDGSHLAFLSKEELGDYDNGAKVEAYLYGPPVGGGAPVLRCASCNPTGERAQGQASIPGALINGSSTSYLPRALSSDGQRLFFTSSDALAVQDTNGHPDVYQWEAKGKGDCNRSPGCAALISSGRSGEGATFIDASSDGSDVFFTTDGSLAGEDPGAVDLYDARAEGGFPQARQADRLRRRCLPGPAGPTRRPRPRHLDQELGQPIAFL